MVSNNKKKKIVKQIKMGNGNGTIPNNRKKVGYGKGMVSSNVSLNSSEQSKHFAVSQPFHPRQKTA